MCFVVVFTSNEFDRFANGTPGSACRGICKSAMFAPIEHNVDEQVTLVIIAMYYVVSHKRSHEYVSSNNQLIRFHATLLAPDNDSNNTSQRMFPV